MRIGILGDTYSEAIEATLIPFLLNFQNQTPDATYISTNTVGFELTFNTLAAHVSPLEIKLPYKDYLEVVPPPFQPYYEYVLRAAQTVDLGDPYYLSRSYYAARDKVVCGSDIDHLLVFIGSPTSNIAKYIEGLEIDILCLYMFNQKLQYTTYQEYLKTF